MSCAVHTLERVTARKEAGGRTKDTTCSSETFIEWGHGVLAYQYSDLVADGLNIVELAMAYAWRHASVSFHCAPIKTPNAPCPRYGYTRIIQDYQI